MPKKKWYQSKQIWLAVLQGIAGVLIVVETQYPGVGGVVIVKSVLDVALRFLTTTSIQS